MRSSIVIVLLSLIPFYGLFVLGIDIESEHILTVCDTDNILHTRKGEPIPNCSSLLPPPPPDGFFSHLKTVRQFDSGCAELDAKNVTASDETIAKVVAGGVATLKCIADAIKTQVEHLVNAFLASAENTSGLGSIHKSWNNRLFIAVSVCCCLVLQFRSGSRVRDCWFNAVIGTLAPAVLYSAQLYFNTWYCVAILVSTTLVLYRPALGFLTLFQLILPLSRIILRLAFELRLFFGPCHSFLTNGGAILVHLFCIIGLYVDEKLLIVKVLLLPLYRTLVDLFIGSDRRHLELLESVKRAALQLFSSPSEQPPAENGLQLDALMQSQMRRLCENATRSWYTTCPTLFSRSCSAYVNGTVLAEADRDLGIAGQWLSDLISTVPGANTNKATVVQRTAAKQLCQQLTDSVCHPFDLATYCTPDKTFLVRAYDTFTAALGQLKNTVLLNQPWIKLITDKLPISFVFSSDDFVNVIQLIRHCVSILFASFAVVFIFRATWKAIFFLRRYQKDFKFCNSDRKCRKLLSTSIGLGRCQLLIRLCVIVALERGIKQTYSVMQQIRFVVPERGSTRFAFQVQGDGTIAAIFRFLFGGLDISSKYCKLADASVCEPGPYQPVSLISWSVLFILAILHPLAFSLSRSDGVLCRICDRFLMPEIGRKRAKIRRVKRLKRLRKLQILIRAMAVERLPEVELDNNRLLVAFYSRKRWYHHRYVPEIVQSLAAYFQSGRLLINPSLACQICCLYRIEWMYQCGTLLFCDNCRFHLLNTRCPCDNSTIYCSDGKIVGI